MPGSGPREEPAEAAATPGPCATGGSASCPPTPISRPNADLYAQCKVKRAQLVRNLRRRPWSSTQHRAFCQCPARSPRWPVPASTSDAGTTAPQPTDTGSGTESAPAHLPHPGPPSCPAGRGSSERPPAAPSRSSSPPTRVSAAVGPRPEKILSFAQALRDTDLV